MNVLINIGWLVILISFIGSCAVLPSYRSVNIEGDLRAAKIDVPKGFEQAELLVVNRTNDVNETGDNVSLNTKEKNKLVDHILNEFQNEVTDRKQLETVKGIKQTKTVISGAFPRKINNEIAKRLTFGRRLIAALEYINVNTEDTYYDDWENTYDVNNILIRRRKIVIGQKNIQAETGWRLYDTAGNVIDEFTINKQYSYQVKAVNRYTAKNKLAYELGVAQRNLGEKIGFQYADRISPYRSYIKRNYYIRSRTANQFEVAMKYIDNNDWETALGVWQEIIEFRKNEQDVAKAYFNIAVYYEYIKELDKAIQYALLSTQTDSDIGYDYQKALLDVRENGYALH